MNYWIIVENYHNRLQDANHNFEFLGVDLRKFERNSDEYWKPAMSNVDFDIDGFWPYNFCIGEIE